MSNPTYQQFLQVLRGSQAAQMVTPTVLRHVAASFANSSEEQLKEAIQLIEENNAQQAQINNKTATQRQELVQKMQNQTQKVKKIRLKSEESQENRATSAAADEMLNQQL